jgi:hypothetical protein
MLLLLLVVVVVVGFPPLDILSKGPGVTWSLSCMVPVNHHEEQQTTSCT